MKKDKTDDIWTDVEEKPETEAELFSKEDLDPEEGKGEKEDSKDQELKTVEEEEAKPDIAMKARVRKREEEKAEYERRLKEAEESVYRDEDFEEAQKFEFSKNKIMVDGEEKSLDDIAKEYPDVTALIRDAVGRVSKELGAPLKSAQEYIADSRFWTEVEASHPGAQSMKNNKEFMAWVDSDPDLQTLSSTGNPEDIVFILDTWKAKNTPKVDKAKEAKKNILAKSKGSTVENKPKVETEDVLTPETIKSIWD